MTARSRVFYKSFNTGTLWLHICIWKANLSSQRKRLPRIKTKCDNLTVFGEIILGSFRKWKAIKICLTCIIFFLSDPYMILDPLNDPSMILDPLKGPYPDPQQNTDPHSVDFGGSISA
jgi:hypothetical protein